MDELRKVVVQARADTGADFLCLPSEVVLQLNLEGEERRTYSTADGVSHSCRYVGPVKVQFDNRSCYVGALELGNEVLLGAIPMEDMDLVVHPKTKAVTVNPEHPNIAHGYAMGFRASPESTDAAKT